MRNLKIARNLAVLACILELIAFAGSLSWGVLAFAISMGVVVLLLELAIKYGGKRDVG